MPIRSLLLLLATVALALGAAAPALALPPVTPDTPWIVDGNVDAFARDGQTLYLGGDFDRLNRRTGGGVQLAAPGGQLAGGPEFDRSVSVAEPDGAGGFYVGGSFNFVGGVPREGLAHIRADGTLDPAFAPPPVQGTVSALAVHGTRLYVGGNFTAIGGTPRRSLAVVDRTTGALDGDFTAGINGYSGYVGDLELTPGGGVLYIGGSFNCAGAIGGSSDCGDVAGEETRNFAAAFTTTNGALRSWTPNAGQTVDGLELSSTGTVVLGGAFACVNTPDVDCADADAGQDVRRSVAEVDGTTGAATAFTFNVGVPGTTNGHVREILVETGDVLTVVGRFTCVGWNGDGDCTDGGEASRDSAARIPIGGAVSAWAPDVAGGDVHTVARRGTGELWLGGSFTSVGGASRRHLAAVTATTGAPLAANPGLNGPVNTLAVASSRLFAGGQFTGAGGVERRNLAAIDLRTGQPTAFDPRPDGEVSALRVAGGRLYAGGYFEHVGATPRGRLAAFSLANGALTGWAPVADSDVSALAVSGTRVYAGGSFTKIGAIARDSLASLDATTGAVDTGFPQAGGTVNDLAVGGGRLFAAGDFNGGTAFGGLDRDYLAAVDLASRQVAPWAPRANAPMHALEVDGGRVYAGGELSALGAAERYGVVALDGRTGALQPWNPGLESNDRVLSISADDGEVAIGGAFGEIGTATGYNVALLSAADGKARAWDPDVDGDVRAIELATGAVYAGGSFSSTEKLAQAGLATFTPAPVNLAPPAVTGTVAPGSSAGCMPGRWQGNPVLQRTWLLNAAPAGGSPAFAVRDEHVGSVLSCRVAAQNVRGQATAFSPGRTVARPGGTGAGAARITLGAQTGKGVRRAKGGYVVRFRSSLRLVGTVTRGGAPVARARLTLARGTGAPRSVTADANGRFAVTIRRPRRTVRIVARFEDASARLRAKVGAALRSTTKKVQAGRRVRISGRVALPKLAKAGKVVVSRNGKRLTAVKVGRRGRFAVRVARGIGARSRYRVRFVPRKGSPFAGAAIRVSVRRPG